MSDDQALLRAEIAQSGFFDAAWYLHRYPDVGQLGLAPLDHFARIGARIGRSPGPGFDAQFYLSAHADVRRLDAPPFLHYLRHGRPEGREALPPAPRPAEAGTNGLSGALDLQADHPVIHGWLAMDGDSAPRQALLRIDGAERRLHAGAYRADLQKAGVGAGMHGFRLTARAALLDGQPHRLELIDAATGTQVAEYSFTWARPSPRFDGFAGFLAASMTEPMLLAPFQEPHKRVFAQMEALAGRLEAAALALEVPPLVSVIMPVFNRAGIVRAAIASVLAQSWPHLELICVDDGSSDGSVAAIRAFDDPRLRLIELGRNVGHSAARNAGLEAASGEIIAFLDSDNHWDGRYLAATVGAFAQHPGAEALYSGLYFWRGDESAPSGMRFGAFNRALLENGNYIDLNGFALRASLHRRIGGFETGLRRYVDYDLILRASEAGTMIGLPVCLCHYTLGKTDNAVSDDPRLGAELAKVHARMEARAEARRAEAEIRLTRPVAALIPNWEALDDLKECIAALEAEGHGERLQIIIADNASGPETRAWLRGLADERRIRLIENARNLGFSAAVNQAAELAAPGADLMILNNDAVLLRGALRALQQAAHELPDAAMTVPRQILPSGEPTIRDHVPGAADEGPCDVTLSAAHDNIAALPLWHDGGPVELTYAPFFAVYLRRDAWAAAGPLDAEHGRHYRSDRLYCDLLRVFLRRRLWYVPDAHAIHKLQRATAALQQQGAAGDYEMMFRQNRWDAEAAAALGYQRRAWDLE